MFIKSLTLENFKGFQGAHEVNFNIPDGTTDGSGLNIFVGENNSGKSTVFEALDFIKDSTKKVPESLINKSDPAILYDSFSVEVTYTGDISRTVNAHVQQNKIRSFLNCIYIEDGVSIFKVKIHRLKWSQGLCFQHITLLFYLL